MKICETNSSEKMIFTVKWSHSLVESRSENIKLFENFYPAPLVIVQFSQRKFFKKFIFFVPVDAQTHTWAHTNDGIEEKKSKIRKNW